jgi:hypothetical protein
MSPKSSCVEGSVPSEAVFRDGAFGRWLDHGDMTSSMG